MSGRERLALLLSQAWEHPLSDQEQWLADHGLAVLTLIDVAQAETISHSFALTQLEHAVSPLLRTTSG